VATIEGHAARGIAAGEVDIGTVMQDEHRDRIANWMREHSNEGLTQAKQHFEGRYTYGQLRMVQVWLNK
jgi:hypothetical protein